MLIPERLILKQSLRTPPSPHPPWWRSGCCKSNCVVNIDLNAPTPTPFPLIAYSDELFPISLLLNDIIKDVLDFAILRNPCLNPSFRDYRTISFLSSAPSSNKWNSLLKPFTLRYLTHIQRLLRKRAPFPRLYQICLLPLQKWEVTATFYFRMSRYAAITQGL